MLEQFLITFQILIIDVVMAADNAIIIGLIAANFAPDNRKKIIALGGISTANVKKLNLINCSGFAGISFFEQKKGPYKRGPF